MVICSQDCKQKLILLITSNSVFSFGVFFPTVEADNLEYGAFSDFYSYQKYLSNTLSTYFNFAIQKKQIQGFYYGAEVGFDMMVPTQKADKLRETELNGHYALNVGYELSDFMLTAELLGVAILTEDLGNLGDQFYNSVAIGTQYRGDIVTPKVFL